MSLRYFKLPGKYNKEAGNKTARDFLWFYFSSLSYESSWEPRS